MNMPLNNPAPGAYSAALTLLPQQTKQMSAAQAAQRPNQQEKAMLLDLLRTRRSVRRYTEQPVETEKINQILEAARLAPSSKSKWPWQLVVVRERERLDQLAAAKPHGAAFLKHAPLAIVVCGDTAASDAWVEDCSIAAFLLHLEATDLGLASCWVQLRLREHDEQQSAPDYVARILHLPPHLQPLAMVAIGHPGESKAALDPTELRKDRISSERLGEPWRS